MKKRSKWAAASLGLAVGVAGALIATGPPANRTPLVDGLRGLSLSALRLPDAAPSLTPSEAERGAIDAAEEAGLYWSVEPNELQVYRSTALHLRVDALPDAHPEARCEWSFGDGTPAVRGCTISHTFHGGRADQPVTLTVSEGEWRLRSTRVVPLERLPVTPLPGGREADTKEVVGALPAPPEPGTTSFRLALVADTAGADDAELSARMAALRERVKPQLVIHMGGIVPTEGGDAGWERAREIIDRPLRGAGVPLAWAMAPADLMAGARVRRPTLTLLDGVGYPERYTFSFKGVFFLVFASDPEDGVTDDDLSWMRAALSEAQVYTSRIVVSHLPLHQFTETGGAGVLNQKLRIYELLLRARVTALISAGQGVYFVGRYGALPVVSVGPLGSAGGELSGSGLRQERSFAVIDIVKGVPERIFAVEGPDFDRALDESYLPEAVEVYVR